MQAKQKHGLLSESYAMSALIENDIPFAIPYGSFDEFDFVVKTPSGFKSIQVKTCYKDNCKNRYIVSLCTSHRRGGEVVKNKKYSVESFDYLIAVCHDPVAFYVIPVAEIADRRSITLYPNEIPVTAINNYRFTSMKSLEQYRDAWGALK
jgi:hypothetical protein